MISILGKAVCASVFALSAVAVLRTAPPTGCRIKVTNDGTEASPHYLAECDGSCVSPQSDPCTVDRVVGRGENGTTIYTYFCKCDGVEVPPTTTQGCTGNFNNSGGWHFVCQKAGCKNTCSTSSLPVAGTTVYGCTCPDV